MRKLLLITLIMGTFTVFGQRKPKIKGNRIVTEIREELPPFNSIELIDDLEVMLQPSSAAGYSLVADDNLVDVLKFKVEDSTLVISSFYNITASKKLEITILYEELKSLNLKEGKIVMEDILSSEQLSINTSGTAKIQLNARSEVIQLSMEGSSSGDFNLDSDSLNIHLKDKADARIYSVGASNTVEMLNNASAQLEGTADTLQLKLYDNSGMKAERLEAGKAIVFLEDSPSVRVYALRTFELTSRGSAKTYLYGNPEISIHEFLDTSEMYKRND